eukprot:113146_1
MDSSYQLSRYSGSSTILDRSFSTILFISVGVWLYMAGYFYRGSLGPIVDPLQLEFKGTSSDIGLISSIFWLGYSIFQIPSGFLLQYFTPELILIIASFFLGITSASFGLPFNKNSVTLPAIIMFISGIAFAPSYISVVSFIGVNLGNNYTALVGGIQLFLSGIFLFAANLLQAWLYEQFDIWREVYWVLGGLVMFSCIILYVTTICNTYTYKPLPKSSMSVSVQLSNVSGNLSPAGKQSSSKSPLIEHQTTAIKRTCFGIPIKRTIKQAENGVKSLLFYAFSNPWNYILGLYCFSISSLFLALNELWLIPFLSVKFGYSREQSTNINGYFWISGAIGNLLFGKLAAKFKKRKIFFIFSAALLFAPLYIIYCNTKNEYCDNVYIISIMNVLSGFSTAPIAIVWTLVREYNDHYGCSDLAGGLMNTMGCTSGFVVQWMIGVLMDIHWEQRGGEYKANSERDYNVQDYQFGFVIIPIICALNWAMVLIFRETNAKSVVYDDNKRYCARFFC